MKTKVLMVCLGNICRSPLAEGILQSKVDADSVFVDSAGTAGYHVGNPPDKRSIAVARKYGLNITHQKCRKFSEQDFTEFDLIYVMDRSNFSDVASLAKNQEEAGKVKLLLSEVELGIKEVPDPYYGGDDGFENVYQMIDRACEAIAKKLN
ncbi:MAG: low molecular weight protein-tyrosine-phosphatase [Bacteroidota bacterium]|uniref:protein-tyrosine-phosphatase n=1 Tax=Flagellimonas profundi TaxID=2915620 RepID=A0ABS3FDM4_9FLAO|nr:low molecular weight protein-tyrosine-phosphatase [Allomuricauda profundi]MBO0341249.1 low molecular weight phosphotyrosine protein phosphatase [Allomuricauda profundi]MEC7771134.1 low molecular weight protein-tyrosine-phosphatase [Bacteroidota bacterium]